MNNGNTKECRPFVKAHYHINQINSFNEFKYLIYIYMKLGFSYKFLFYLLLIVIIAYIALKYNNLIEGNKTQQEKQEINKQIQQQIQWEINPNNPQNVCVGAAAAGLGPRTRRV